MGGELAELGLPLEELVRRGARDILQRAIEAELGVLLDEFASVSLIDGRRAVVRNGYLPAREILTTVGPVAVQVPKVRDRTGSGVKFNSTLAPPYVRRSARVAAALPWLYLKGISSGDLGEALEVLVGDGAKGLSPAALGRLKTQWSADYQGWAGRSLEGKEYAYWWVDGWVFHANWTPIPAQAGHPFHANLDSRSEATRGVDAVYAGVGSSVNLG